MELLIDTLALEGQAHLALNERFVSLDNETRAAALQQFMSKLSSGEYRTEPQPCLCGIDDGILISEIDRYGIPLNTVLCKNCGVMRSDPYYTDATLESFYQNEYRPIYTGDEQSSDLFFENQCQSGTEILNYLKPFLPQQATVIEIGAGAGGILHPFAAAGHTVRGCDLGSQYINYGAKREIELYEGDFTTMLSFPPADVLILNHLLEHIKDPVKFLNDVQVLLKPQGLIYIGVPGLVFYPIQYRSKLLFYLQNAHCYHYCLQTLEYAASLAGLSLVSGNEKIVSVFRRQPTNIPTSQATPSFLIEIIQKAQRLWDYQKSQEAKNKELSRKITEDKASLRRVRIALKKSRVRIEEQKGLLLQNDLLIADQATSLSKISSDLSRKKKEIIAIKSSFGWKTVCFIRKALNKLGISTAYNACIMKPLRLVTKKRHWHLFFRMFPVRKDVIFFESHRGLSYADSPKFICEEIIARGLPVRCVWSMHDTSLEMPRQIEKVKRFSIAYYYYHACSRILIQNGEFAQSLLIRKNQTYINTQHGTPLKLMGIDIIHKKPTIDIDTYSKNGRWSYLVSPNAYSTEIFKRAYVFSGPVLEVGYPRNDIFYRRNTPGEVALLKQKLGLPTNLKIILYAPTWRDVKGSGIDRNFKLQLDIERLFKEFGDTHVVILRLHHLIVSVLKIDEKFSNFAFEFSSAKYDIQELMLVSDILVTDYSSVMFDYSNLSRPIIYFAYDFEEYSTDIRGTYFDLKDHAPGPVVETMDELVYSIQHIEEWTEEFALKQAAFREKFCSLENGSASARVIDEIIKPEIGLR